MRNIKILSSDLISDCFFYSNYTIETKRIPATPKSTNLKEISKSIFQIVHYLYLHFKPIKTLLHQLYDKIQTRKIPKGQRPEISRKLPDSDTGAKRAKEKRN